MLPPRPPPQPHTIIIRSTAPGGRPAGVALGTGAATHQRQLAALLARVALVALQPGDADLLLQRARGPRRRRRRRPVAVLGPVVVPTAVAVGVAVAVQRVQVAAP